MLSQYSTTPSRRVTLIAYAPLFLWTCVVLGLSFGEASMSQTSRIIVPILKFLFPNATDATIVVYHGFIRKSAHFTEYAILAFWAIRAFSRSSVSFLRDRRFWITILLVVCVASIDEYHQSFVPSRTSSISDVLLDCAGGAAMTLIFRLFTKWRSHPNQTAAPNCSE